MRSHWKNFIFVAFGLSSILISSEIFAHGERAQQAGLRMRAANWFDTEIFPRTLEVNETLTVRGKFVPSEWWPKQLPSPEGMAFLNIGVPGPVFVRIDSRVNGVSMIRSTTFKRGETYEYEISLKARTPGRYHVHPVLSVEGTGPIIGPAKWVEVTGSQSDFVNEITTLTGETLNLETHGLKVITYWHLFWAFVGFAWLFYWLFPVFKGNPVLLPRFKQVVELGDDKNAMITMRDTYTAIVFFVFILIAIAAGYMGTQYFYPVTTPLQTGEVELPSIKTRPANIEIEVGKALYHIPGRSFELKLNITNNEQYPLRVGEFLTANIRFINPDVLDVQPEDEHDLVAPEGLRVEADSIAPGQTRLVTLFAEDALWETYRLTSLIYDPDSRYAGMLFLYGPQGQRHYLEVGGYMVPSFDQPIRTFAKAY